METHARAIFFYVCSKSSPTVRSIDPYSLFPSSSPPSSPPLPRSFSSFAAYATLVGCHPSFFSYRTSIILLWILTLLLFFPLSISFRIFSFSAPSRRHGGVQIRRFLDEALLVWRQYFYTFSTFQYFLPTYNIPTSDSQLVYHTSQRHFA